MSLISLKQPIKFWWLFGCCLLILLIIFVGGITRLTNSGLSIVEWKPITGIIPPLNLQDWQIEFAKYKISPEYIHYNFSMSLTEFKFIYYMEYIHRMLGRLIALVFTIPFAYFYFAKQIRATNLLYYLLITLLLLLQGFIGWYMVKSGLTAVAHVSHYRLALHFMMAVIIYSLLLLRLCAIIRAPEKNQIKSQFSDLSVIKILCFIALIIIYTQLTFGALLAGLKGGYIYNSFPLMGDKFIPNELYIAKLSLSNPVLVQFIHRIIAYSLVIILGLLTYFLVKIPSKKFNRIGIYIIISLSLQIISGIITLIFVVPISFALIHQLGAMFLLSGVLCCYSFLKHNDHAAI